MSRKIGFVLFFMAAAVSFSFAADADPSVPQNIRNNQYYLESLRLAKLAHDTYEYGDYDGSANYAQEAIRYAQLSDEYVALQLKIKEANDAITAAKQRLDWAVSSGAAKQYPAEYAGAGNYYNASLKNRSSEEWDDAIANANRVVELLAYIRAPAEVPPVQYPDGTLPAQYTVRTWAEFKDCLWNIAGRSYIYGDPRQWRQLYNANKQKLPDPDNPDRIEPGMVLDIPSIKGETRQGIYEPGKTYNPAP